MSKTNKENQGFLAIGAVALIGGLFYLLSRDKEESPKKKETLYIGVPESTAQTVPPTSAYKKETSETILTEVLENKNATSLPQKQPPINPPEPQKKYTAKTKGYPTKPAKVESIPKKYEDKYNYNDRNMTVEISDEL